MYLNNAPQARLYVEKALKDLPANTEFILFEAIVRKKDNPNNPYLIAHKDSFLVRSWYVDTLERFDKLIQEMITIAHFTGARLYMCCDVKSVDRMAKAYIMKFQGLANRMINRDKPSLKAMMNSPVSVAASEEASIHQKRTYLFDIDTEDANVWAEVYNAIPDDLKEQSLAFKSPNGHHIITPRFNIGIKPEGEFLHPDVTVKPNAMTIVYYNDEEEYC